MDSKIEVINGAIRILTPRYTTIDTKEVVYDLDTIELPVNPIDAIELLQRVIAGDYRGDIC